MVPRRPPSQNPQLTPKKKAFALGLIAAGLSKNKVAEKVGVSSRTIKRLAAKARELPPMEVTKRTQGTGPKKKLGLRTMLKMKRLVERTPSLSSRKIKQNMSHGENQHNWEMAKVSIRTVQRSLQFDCNLPSRRPAKKPLITERMREKRLRFCEAHRHWTVEDWSRVMFTDESTFRTIRSSGSTMVRRSPGTNRYDPMFTVKTVKHAPSVMVWGGFSMKGRGGLHFLPKGVTMNSVRYCDVLRDHLFPFLPIHNCDWFLQDSAPCHASKFTKNFIREQAPDLKIIDWPGNSPDLNPIENLWCIMKDRLQEKDTASVPKLIESIKEIWCTGITPNIYENLVASMPRRMELVIQAQGHMTKY